MACLNEDPHPSVQVCENFINEMLGPAWERAVPIGGNPEIVCYSEGRCALMGQTTLGKTKVVDFANERLRNFLRYIASYGFSYSEVWEGVRYKFVPCEYLIPFKSPYGFEPD